jgi:hypothetical protein
MQRRYNLAAWRSWRLQWTWRHQQVGLRKLSHCASDRACFRNLRDGNLLSLGRRWSGGLQ